MRSAFLVLAIAAVAFAAPLNEPVGRPVNGVQAKHKRDDGDTTVVVVSTAVVQPVPVSPAPMPAAPSSPAPEPAAITPPPAAPSAAPETPPPSDGSGDITPDDDGDDDPSTVSPAAAWPSTTPPPTSSSPTAWQTNSPWEQFPWKHHHSGTKAGSKWLDIGGDVKNGLEDLFHGGGGGGDWSG